jgi:hypothetical protein
MNEYHSTRGDWKHRGCEDDTHMHRRGMIEKIGVIPVFHKRRNSNEFL